MNDYDQMVAMLRKAGIGFAEDDPGSDFKVLILEAHVGNVEDYNGFKTVYTFAADGSLHGIDISE